MNPQSPKPVSAAPARPKKPNPLVALRAQIAERSQYLADQEQAIETAVAIGRDRLHEIQFEVDTALKEKERILVDITRLEQQRPKLIAEITTAQQKLDALHDLYQSKAAEYRGKLSQLANISPR